MITLRIHPRLKGDNEYKVDLSLEGDSITPQKASVSLKFVPESYKLNAARWYLEDYLHVSQTATASTLENEWRQVGLKLFSDLFTENKKARALWNALKNMLFAARIEVVTGGDQATLVPWHLLREPDTDHPLRLAVQSFVYVVEDAPDLVYRTSANKQHVVRILFLINKPADTAKIPFRPAGVRLINGLDEITNQFFQIEMVRPPTLARLREILFAARQRGKPYHVVHYDGSLHASEVQTDERVGERLNRLIWGGSGPETYRMGNISLANPALPGTVELLDGRLLGELLVEAGVPILVLNQASRAITAPLNAPQDTPVDVETQLFTYDALARFAVNSGLPAVIALPYHLYDQASAQFFVDLYANLTQALSIGDAVTLSCQQLAASPLRVLTGAPREMQDWVAPIVYENQRTYLFPEPLTETPPKIALKSKTTTAEPVGLTIASLKLEDHQLIPDTGLYGRLETLLALDRAFDDSSVVVLHGYAGSGTTSTAAAFAYYYTKSNGFPIGGYRLFTFFGQYTPLPSLLESLAKIFKTMLQANQVVWKQLPPSRKREVMLQMLQEVRVFWIWDNVEAVTGFPAGNDTPYTRQEQRDLVDFLEKAANTKAKFLLTSRRNERTWLGGDFATRVALPPLRLQSGFELTQGLLDQRGLTLTEIYDWRPILQFSQGNPMAHRVLVAQALRENLKTAEAIKHFMAGLSQHRGKFREEAVEGRSANLGAALAYSFEQAFSQRELKQAALLYLFRRFVDTDLLLLMSHPQVPWSLTELQGIDRPAAILLLNRIAEDGLLTPVSRGAYFMHPAFEWFFETLFREHYPSDSNEANNRQLKAERAFVKAVAALANHHQDLFNSGKEKVILLLTAQEANMLTARKLAMKNDWFRGLLLLMKGLHTFYQYLGRLDAWQNLLEAVTPHYVNSETGQALPDREEEWATITRFRVAVTKQKGKWDKAIRLQTHYVEYKRHGTPLLLRRPLDMLDSIQRNELKDLAAALVELGDLQAKIDDRGCILAYSEAVEVFKHLEENLPEAETALKLGDLFFRDEEKRNLNRAEEWYKRSLDKRTSADRVGRYKALDALGEIHFERFLEAEEAGRLESHLLDVLNDAAFYYHQAVVLLSDSATDQLAVTYNRLGLIYKNAKDNAQAVKYYELAITFYEKLGNQYRLASAQRNLALALYQAKSYQDAATNAETALKKFNASQHEEAEEMVKKTRELLKMIAQDRESAKEGTSS